MYLNPPTHIIVHDYADGTYVTGNVKNVTIPWDWFNSDVECLSFIRMTVENLGDLNISSKIKDDYINELKMIMQHQDCDDSCVENHAANCDGLCDHDVYNGHVNECLI